MPSAPDVLPIAVPPHKAPETRIHELDGVRGMAAVVIAVMHAYFFFSKQQFLEGGWLAVDVFFILSGIVLSHVYECKIFANRRYVAEFWLHRFARLYPLHLFTLVIIGILALFQHRYGPMLDLITLPVIHGETSSVAFSLLMNLLMLQSAGFGGDFSWDSPSWSISVEVAVNACWILALLRTKKSAPLLGLVLLPFLISINLCGFAPGHIFENAYGLISFNVLRGMMGFTVGVLCYRHIIPLLPLISGLWANMAALLTAFITCVLFWIGPTIIPGSFYCMVLIVLPIFILCSMHKKAFLHFFFKLPPMIWLGKISYSLYLMHAIIWHVLLAIHDRIDHPTSMPVFGGIYIVSILVISAAVYQWIEVPARRQITARWDSRFPD